VTRHPWGRQGPWCVGPVGCRGWTEGGWRDGCDALDGGKAIYQAEVDHLSWWAVGEVLADPTCLRGCVHSDETAVAGARVIVQGVDHHALTHAYTDGDGCFVVDAAAQSQVSVGVESAEGYVPAVSLTTGAADGAGACQDMGTLALVADEAFTSACPGGMDACGGGCFDLAQSIPHCGTCGTSCAAARREHRRVQERLHLQRVRRRCGVGRGRGLRRGGPGWGELRGLRARGHVGCADTCDAYDPETCVECLSCRDCGNQACNDGVCGECERHSDCCSPLMCSGGTCYLVDG
jgi:hypothetical protein